MFLYVVSSRSMRVLNTQQVYGTMSFPAVLARGDCSAELSGFEGGVLFTGVVCLFKILVLLAVLKVQATVVPQDGEFVVEFSCAQY